MPLIPFTSTPIVMEVADRVVGDTIIKQKATFVSLSHGQNQKESQATIQVLVTLYANSGGAYGDPLLGKGTQPYLVTMSAANDTLVNAQTGEILAVRTTEPDLSWRALADLHPDPVMFQGDFFEMLREQPVKIADLIRSHITNADTLGRFNQ